MGDVGGLDATRRVRELRAEGHPIEKRVHPAGLRYGYQYRLVREERFRPREVWRCETCGNEPRRRPQIVTGGIGIDRCDTCKSRRYFKQS